MQKNKGSSLIGYALPSKLNEVSKAGLAPILNGLYEQPIICLEPIAAIGINDDFDTSTE